MSKNSVIIFSKNIPIDKDYKDVVNYNSGKMLETMRSENYFVSQSNDYSFIKHSDKNKIRTSLSFATAQTVNYIAFQNSDYYSKWYFAFVDEVEFISPACTEITFTLDYWTTWYDQFQLKPCYVLREHVNDDTIGKNTIPENLSVGEVIANEDPIYDSSLDSNYFIAVTTNWNPKDETGFIGVTAFTKTIFGQMVCIFPLNESGIYNLEHFIAIIGSQGHTSDIQDIFIIPQDLVSTDDYTTYSFSKIVAGVEVSCVMNVLRYDTANAYKSVTKGYFIDKLHSYSNLTIRNNKCFCYPYNYLLVSNNIGSQNIYKYEDFGADSEGNLNSCDFQLQMSLTVGISGRVVPLNYKNVDENVDESIEMCKLPTCSWSSDSYTNWLTQNAVNISQRILGTEVTSAIGKIGEVISLNGKIGELLGNFSKQQLLPQITGGQATGDVNFASKTISPRFIRMRAKNEYLQIIDDYFSRFGYSILRVKVPNFTGRQNWNYVEIGVGEIAVEGEIPAKAKEQINQICRNGVTIWHNLDNVGNFTLSNAIILV